MHQVVANPGPLPVEQITFSGERPAFRKLVTRGALLELVTFGFYRFWLATDIRRHLWSQTAVGGDPAEYTGRAKELLIGFLIAMAILMPVYLAYFLIGLEAERLQAFASVPLIVFLYLFTEFARYRARRYRVTRTLWRGLRFSMGGSGWSYSWRSGLWWLLVGVSLGLALPWRQAALERFKMRHTAYGSLQGRFDGTGRDLFKQAWQLWLVALLTAFVMLAGTAAPILMQLGGSAALFGFIPPWLLALSAIILVIASPFTYAAFKAIEWRWWVSGLRFGDIRFESRLETGALIGRYWAVIGWSLLFLLLFVLWCIGAFLLISPLVATGGSSEERIIAASQHPAMLASVVIGYLLVAIALGAVIRLYLNRDVWRLVALSTVVHNLAAADDVAGQGATVGALGEGFADGLDVAGF